MRASRWCFLALALLFAVLPPSIFAQREKRQPLSEAQVEKIREAGIDPAQRIKLYVQFLNEHADTVKSLTARGKSASRTKRLDDELLDFTALMDELGANLDQYAERKADLRPGLKKLAEDSPKWITILKALPGEPGFDGARKEAIESGEDLSEDVKRLQQEQDAYFASHKDAKGQEREEPK